MKSIVANSPGWQIESWKLAQARQPFEILGVEPRHQLFIDELRFAYDYQIENSGGKVSFTPQNVAPKSVPPLHAEI